MNRASPIGVFDSGLGGFGVAAIIRSLLPAESILYLGDIAHRPFGPRPGAEVADYTRAAEAFFAREGAKAFVIACNTASVVASDLAGLLPAVEMVAPAVELAAASAPGSVGVLGTLGTIQSGAHQRALAAALPAARVVAEPCEAALRLAEAGGGDDQARLRALLADCIDAVAGCDVTILACTDFTCVRPVLDEVNGGRTTLIDPAEAAVIRLRHVLEQNARLAPNDSTPRHRFCLTAPDPKFAEVGRRLFHLPIERVEMVAIEVTA
jgi:glutamate racemase